MNLKSEIAKILNKNYSLNLSLQDITLENPPKAEFWDYALSCFALAKDLKKAPNMIAEEVKNLLSEITWISNISTIWGYVNFFASSEIFSETLKNVNLNPKSQKNETIIVDYIWTNLGKPLHIGHLCTPAVGQSLINLFRFQWYNVISDSHFWDWGLFGKLVAAYKLFWDRAELEKDPIEYLLALYVKFTADSENNPELEETARKEFRKLSDWDIENVQLWQEFVSYSLNAMNKILATIYVKPDFDIWESFYEWLNLPKLQNYPDLIHTMNDVMAEMLEKWVVTKNEDWSIGMIFPEETKLPSCVVQKRDWTNLYITSDLACIRYRIDHWKPAKIIYCVDVRQQTHFRQAFHIAKSTWSEELANTDLIHAYNWFIKLKEWAMSTRKWTIIRLGDLISEWFTRTKKILEEKWRNLSDENIHKIAVWAIKYSYLAQDREKDVVFDRDKALNFEGNSGPYIQYTFVRAKNILEKVDFDYSKFNSSKFDLTNFDKELIKKLSNFEKIIEDTSSKYKPHTLALYLFEVASLFSSFYVNVEKILEDENIDRRNFRLNIVNTTKNLLETWFEILAMKMPTEM